MKTVLTIAGSDPSGGAGIQADLKTFTAHRVYGMSAITSITAQNTRGVVGFEDVSLDYIEKQLDSIFTDIFPDAIKIGMVSSPEIIKLIHKKLKEYGGKNIVVDPVMVATSGNPLMNPEAVNNLKDYLISLAGIITPNIPEAEVLSGISIRNKTDMEEAVGRIRNLTKASILIKGGHLKTSADDVLLIGDNIYWLEAARIDNKNTHGTGCTLSSAIASNLAKGMDTLEAVKKAKDYISESIAYGLDLGQGRGPLNHMWNL